MSKSKHDKNMDRGAGQQRNPSPMGGGNKPGTMPEEMMGTNQPGGGKNPNDPKRGQDPAWRQKPGGNKS